MHLLEVTSMGYAMTLMAKVIMLATAPTRSKEYQMLLVCLHHHNHVEIKFQREAASTM